MPKACNCWVFVALAASANGWLSFVFGGKNGYRKSAQENSRSHLFWVEHVLH